jgi:HEAT repeat protein
MSYYTVKKIEKWFTNRDISRLIDALNSDNPEIRKASILCLGSFGDAVAIEPLQHVLEYDVDEFVKMTAQDAITNIEKIGLDSRINLEPVQMKIAYNLNIS